MVLRKQKHLIIESTDTIRQLEHANNNGFAGKITHQVNDAIREHVLKVMETLHWPGENFTRIYNQLHMQLDLTSEEYWKVREDIRDRRVHAYLASFRHMFSQQKYMQFCQNGT